MNTRRNDWSFKNNKNLFIFGGLALSSALVYISKWLLAKYKKVTLNEWLNEYLQEIKGDYEKEKKNQYSVPFIAKCMNIVQEIQEYLFQKDFPGLEQERIKNLSNTKEYENLINESFETQEPYYKTAMKVLYDATQIDMEDVQQFMQSVDQNEMKKEMEENKKPYYDKDLPEISPSLLKEAYITYAKTQSEHSRKAAEQMLIMQRKPEYQEIGFKTIIQNKYLLKDLIKSKYHVDSKYLNQLIKKHNLLEDQEVQYYYNTVQKSDL